MHFLLGKMWDLVADLAKSFHDKPTLVDLLVSLKDDRMSMNAYGFRSKSVIETRMATITCKFLEKELMDEIKI